MGQSDFIDDTKLGGMAIGPEGHAAIQYKLDRLKKRADRNPGKFSKEKWQVLHLVRNNSTRNYMLGVTQLESYLSEKDLGVLMVTMLGRNQLCAPCGKDYQYSGLH